MRPDKLAKLPKSIIKKYGISKKAWQVYRSKKSGSGGAKVAKKRRSRKKTKNKGFLSGIAAKVASPAAAVGYGYVRERVSDMIAATPIGQRLPASQFTDEATMLGVAWLAQKAGAGKNPIARKVITAAKAVEWARIGETLADMRGAAKNGTKTATGQLYG